MVDRVRAASNFLTRNKSEPADENEAGGATSNIGGGKRDTTMRQRRGSATQRTFLTWTNNNNNTNAETKQAAPAAAPQSHSTRTSPFTSTDVSGGGGHSEESQQHQHQSSLDTNTNSSNDTRRRRLSLDDEPSSDRSQRRSDYGMTGGLHSVENLGGGNSDRLSSSERPPPRRGLMYVGASSRVVGRSNSSDDLEQLPCPPNSNNGGTSMSSSTVNNNTRTSPQGTNGRQRLSRRHSLKSQMVDVKLELADALAAKMDLEDKLKKMEESRKTEIAELMEQLNENDRIFREEKEAMAAYHAREKRNMEESYQEKIQEMELEMQQLMGLLKDPNQVKLAKLEDENGRLHRKIKAMEKRIFKQLNDQNSPVMKKPTLMQSVTEMVPATPRVSNRSADRRLTDRRLTDRRLTDRRVAYEENDSGNIVEEDEEAASSSGSEQQQQQQVDVDHNDVLKTPTPYASSNKNQLHRQVAPHSTGTSSTEESEEEEDDAEQQEQIVESSPVGLDRIDLSDDDLAGADDNGVPIGQISVKQRNRSGGSKQRSSGGNRRKQRNNGSSR